MGCLLALFAMVSPRLAIFLLWLFSDRMKIAFDSGWIALLGFFFLPWTALAWAVCFQFPGGVSGFGYFVVGFGFIVDVSSWGSSDRARRQRANTGNYV